MGANFLAPQFWDSPKVAKLGPVGKTLFACMIAGPQLSRVPGLYRGSRETFYRPMKPWGIAEVDSAFQGILDAGMAQFDPEAHVIRLPKVWKYHPPANANQIRGWRREWANFPHIDLIFDHLDSLRRLAMRSDSGVLTYDSYFGGIRKGEPETYPFNSSWVENLGRNEGKGSPKGSVNGSGNGSKTPRSGKTSDSPETKIDHLFDSKEERGRRSEREEDSDSDSDSSLPQRFGNGSGTVGGTVPTEGKNSRNEPLGRRSRPRPDDVTGARADGSASGAGSAPPASATSVRAGGAGGGRGSGLAPKPVSHSVRVGGTQHVLK